MRLLAVELNRFRSRRAIALLGAGSGRCSPSSSSGKTAWDTRPLTHEDRADAAAQAAARGPARRDPAGGRAPAGPTPQDYLGPDATAGECADALVPGPEAYYPRDPLSLRAALSTAGARASRWPWSSPA